MIGRFDSVREHIPANVRVAALLGPLVLTAAACGSGSTGTPHKAPTTLPTSVAKTLSGVTIKVGQVIPHTNYALLHLSIHNPKAQPFQPDSPFPFSGAGFITPISRPNIGNCDADMSRGQPLEYQSIAASGTAVGWIRCDYPKGSTVLVLFWENHQVGGFHLG